MNRTTHAIGVTLAATAAIGLAGAGSASATSSHPTPNDTCFGVTEYSVANPRPIGQRVTPIASVEGFAPTRLLLNYAITVSNSFDAQLGVTAGAVTATVGYDVTHTEAVTMGGMLDAVTPGVLYRLTANQVDDITAMDRSVRTNTCGAWLPAGIVEAYEFDTVTYSPSTQPAP